MFFRIPLIAQMPEHDGVGFPLALDVYRVQQFGSFWIAHVKPAVRIEILRQQSEMVI